MPSTTGISRNTLVERLGKLTTEAKGLADAFPVDERGNIAMSSDHANKYRTTMKEAREVKGLLADLDEHGDLTELVTRDGRVPDAARAAGMSGGDTEAKSLGDMFTSSEDYRALRSSDRAYRGEALRGGMEGKSIFSLSGGSVTHQALGSHQNLGITEMAKRKWHVRDLFPKSTTSASVLYGVREVGWTNNAAQVKQRYAADGVSPATGTATDTWGRAPKSDVHLTPVLYPVAEVAHTLDAHKNILADEPRLKTFLNTRMLEGVKFREDYDLLHSVGDGERLTGLFNTPGIQEYDGIRTEAPSIQVRRAITKALLAEYDPSGLVLSPGMWEELEIETDDTGAFRIALQVAVGAEKRLWRLNVVETTAMADTTFLIGAFGLGAQLHDREQVSVSVSTENRTNFEDGVVTIRADERLALEVPRPESFVVGTWNGAEPVVAP